MHEFDQFERRLAAALRTDADRSIAPFEPQPIARAAIAASRRRSGPMQGRSGRGLTLLAAAALLLVGGALAAGSGLVRLPSVVPPVPAPSLAAVAVEETPSPAVSPSPEPSVTPVAAQFGSGLFAYIRDDQIWVANADGTGARALVATQGGRIGLGNWSADGTRLVFSLAPRHTTPGYPTFGPSRLYLTDASGSTPELVDTGCVETCSEGDAAFSNDGSRLVFVRGGLATIDLSTGLVTELVSTVPGVGRYPSGAPGTYHPRWSPDGTKIVFIQDVPSTTPPPPDGGIDDQLSGVFVVDADGRNRHRIGPFANAADWSPDGSRIVVGSVSDVITRGPSPDLDVLRQSFDIVTMRPDGTDVRRLTSDQVSHAPRWGADGRILFLRDPDPYAEQPAPIEYWVMDAGGGNATQLTGSPEFQAALVSGLVRPSPP